ncbi:MAG: putative membrane protein YkoI [Alteromonadaceae bacterium]|jgi:uncharacterized membrane protein YkoI
MHILAKAIIAVLMICLFQVPHTWAAHGKGINKSQAVNTVKRKYPGKIIKITNGSNHYQVRLLQKDGRVVNVKVDKNSGKIIKSGKSQKGKRR